MIKLAFRMPFRSLQFSGYRCVCFKAFLCSAADLKPHFFINDRSNRPLGILSKEEKPPAF
jgi:hypothetical protein